MGVSIVTWRIPRMHPVADVLVHLVAWTLLLSVPAILCSFFPNRDFDAVMARDYPGQFAWIVSSHSRFSGDDTFERRAYVLLPSVLQDPKFVSLEQRNAAAPVVSEARGPFRLTAMALFALASFYFWRRWRRSPDDEEA